MSIIIEMNMLIGSFYYSLEQKGRLAIPAAFRKALGDKPILSQGIEKCLQILPFNTWSKLTYDLGQHPLAGEDKRQIRRLLAHTAEVVDYDAQGRMLIPKGLIAWANLRKAVVIAGSIDWVEIWDRETHAQHLHSLQSAATKITQTALAHE